MKKFIFLFLGLSACSGLVKNENGSEYLKQLDAEPVGCVYLYKIESETSVYDADDARRYMENSIVDKARGGNAYWITSQRTKPNEWVFFGPERSFIVTANVYNCPFNMNVDINARNAMENCIVDENGRVVVCR